VPIQGHDMHLRPVVHAVCDDMGNATPIRLLRTWVIQTIDPPLIPPAALGDGSGHSGQVGRGTIVGLSAGRIPWPIGKRERAKSLVLYRDLAGAVRRESVV